MTRPQQKGKPNARNKQKGSGRPKAADIAKDRSPRSWGLAALCILFFLQAITMMWGTAAGYQPFFALWAGAIFVALFFYKKNRDALFENGTPWILVILLAQCLLYFAGLFYSAYPKFALQELFMNCGALFAFAVAYAAFRQDKKNARHALSWLSVCVALLCLVSIELATSRLTLVIFNAFGATFNIQINQNVGAFEANTRITSIVNNPNVFAPIAAFGLFLSLQSRGKIGERGRRNILFMCCAVISAAGFILCFSLGTILAYLAALLVMTVTAKKGDRVAILGVHLYALFAGVVGAAFVFATKDMSIVPLVAVIAAAFAFSFVYAYIKPPKKYVDSSGFKRKAVIIAAVVCVFAIAAAFILKDEYALNRSDMFRRAVALTNGMHTLRLEAKAGQEDAAARVQISSMSYTQAALKESTVLADAVIKPGETLPFEVPEGTAAVFFTFTANDSMTVTSVRLDGVSGTQTLPLRYLLVPEFIVNRLQGIWVNDNAAQRFVFFKDGIRIGMKSPIVGQGGGAFEGALLSVSDYFYMTQHSHNEFIERFVDGGVVGLLLFVAQAVFIFRALWKARQEGKDPGLLPVLAGCMTLIFLHALLEVDFTMPAYRIIAFILIALTAAEYPESAPLKGAARKVPPVTLTALCAIAVLLSVGRLGAISLAAHTPTFSSMKMAAELDPFNGADYKFSYILSSVKTNDPVVEAQAKKYLASVDKITANPSSDLLLAQYYLMKPEPDASRGTAAAEESIRLKRVSPDAWDKVFELYMSALNAHPTDTALAGQIEASIQRLSSYLTELNATLPKTIKPKYDVFT